MPSSSRPYKSKLLRFVLQQWQQGLERQDRAWRQLQSTATWGAQVAVFPIYVVMRALERANFALGSNNTPDTSSSQPTVPTTRAQGNVTDLEHSFTAILTHTQQLLSSEDSSQLVIAPSGSLLSKAQSLLSGVIQRIRQQLPGSQLSTRGSAALTNIQRKQSHLVTSAKPQYRSKGLAVAQSARMRRQARADLLQNGTTLASSIETQKIVLVNPSNEVFDIFTPEQQADLKHYIACVMNAYRESRTIVPRKTKQLSAKTILAIGAVFIAALPMEFRKAWAQVAPGPKALSLPPLETNNPQPRSRVFYPSSATKGTVKTRAQRLSSGATHTYSARHLSSKDPHAFEANINDVSYLEHPLERMLRWLDRVLTWCEHRWQQWLEGRANMG
ncbi:hypothetical protein SPB21_23735 [Leptothoe sp. ISB3NOV94-8A]